MGLTTKEISSSSFNDMISSVDRRSEYVENRAGANVRLNNFLTPYTLDDKSSILNAPCGYSNGVYPSLRPVQTLGSELVTNGDFATDSDWTKGTGWTISGGTANFNGFSNQPLSQDGIVAINKKYKLTYTISNYVRGGINWRFGTSSNLTPVRSANGTYVEYITSTGSDFRGISSGASEFSIDNISVKEATDADFDFTRGSSATRVNEQGLIEDVQILSEELVTNGDFATDSDWTLQSEWTIANGKATYDNSASGTCFQSLSFEVGKKYRVNFEISDFTTDYRFDLYTGVSFIQSAIITSQTSFSILFDGDGGSILRFRGLARGTGFSLDSVSVKEVTDNTDLPRIDYLGGTGSLLLEPQSTNLLTYSQDFSQSYWSRNLILVDDDFTISPDGTQNASKITTNGNTPYLGNQNINLTTGNVYTISCFVKKGTNRWVRLSSVSSASLGAWFDLDNNVVGTVNSTSASIENYGNGWYRISNTITAISGANQTFLGLSDDDGGTTVTGTGHTVFAWGFQVEEQSFATSYIPTSGSTVTRNQDLASNSGSSDLINSTEGVLYAELSVLNTASTTRTISISDGSITNSVEIVYVSSGNFGFRIRVNNAVVYLETSPLSDATQFVKAAISYKSGDIKCFINGSEFDTDTTSFSFTNSLSELAFDRGNGQNNFEGRVRSVAVFKEALTDEELAKITSTTQQEVFYEMRDKMLQINADYYEFGDYTTRLKKLF